MQYTFKNYIPTRHPRQDDIDKFRAIPSLWCGKEYIA